MSTYVPIQAITVTGSNLSGTTGVTFSNIPQTFTDLVIVQSVSLTAPAIGLIRVGNNTIDTGSNYSQTSLSGNGTSANTQRLSNATVWQTVLAHMTSGWGMYKTNIMNYSSPLMNKTCVQRYDNVPYGATEAVVGLWRNTAAINTIQLFLDRAESYLVGSTFTLYGIAAGTTKAIGGEVTVSGGFAYHTFRQSGQFIPSENLTVECLVVAGGGGGGQSTVGGGGGGAGGYRTATGVNLTVNNIYGVIIGSGGTGAGTQQNSGAQGSDSIFHTITSTGGGRGADLNQNGGSGGSGGGSANGAGQSTRNGGLGNTPSTSPAQGNNGGGAVATDGSSRNGGGGGGAGAVGTAGGNSTTGGNGGAGVQNTSFATPTNTGASGFYAGGGAGSGQNADGSAGSGGGGAPNTAGTVNTGGGGGAGRTTGANGGSGLVIVRYAI